MARTPWLNVERRPVNAGHAPVPGRSKFIVHTIEGGLSEGLMNTWASNPGTGLPHFAISGQRIVQFLPLTTCAYTSKNGGINANKVGCPIQVEVAGYAARDWDDATYDAVGRLIARCMEAGVDLDLNQCRGFVGPLPMLATPNHPRRAWTRDSYPSINCVIAHQDLWGNDHWDGGAKDLARIIAHVNRLLGRNPEGDLTMGQYEEIMTALNQIKGEVSALRTQVTQQVIWTPIPWPGATEFDLDPNISHAFLRDGILAEYMGSGGYQFAKKLGVPETYVADPEALDNLIMHKG